VTGPEEKRRSASSRRQTAAVTTALVLTLALQNAVLPFATDLYTPAFPRVSEDLQTDVSLVCLTMTTFFLGMGLGQLLSTDTAGVAQ
jgi:MFS transporter, DHA1 family, multidrug resistance protein